MFEKPLPRRYDETVPCEMKNGREAPAQYFEPLTSAIAVTQT
jgi:hypothetical protein